MCCYFTYCLTFWCEKKKLIEAAEHWASGGGGKDETARALEAFGASSEIIEQAQQISEVKLFEVWAENWETVLMFLRIQTQWQVIQGVVIGLNYSSLIEVMRLYEIENIRGMFEDIQVMELAALPILNKSSG